MVSGRVHRQLPARLYRCSRGLVEDWERARDQVRRRYLQRSSRSATATAATSMACCWSSCSMSKTMEVLVMFLGRDGSSRGRRRGQRRQRLDGSRSWGLARPAARSRGRRTWEHNVGSLASNSTINQSQRRRRSAEDEELNSVGTTQQSTYLTATRELQTSGDGDEDDGEADGVIRKTFGAS